jgi:hypothetical protein
MVVIVELRQVSALGLKDSSEIPELAFALIPGLARSIISTGQVVSGARFFQGPLARVADQSAQIRTPVRNRGAIQTGFSHPDPPR